MEGIIDRFEGDVAVVETDGGFIELSRESLPQQAAEGDVIEIGKEGVEIRADKTKAARAEADGLLNRIFK